MTKKEQDIIATYLVEFTEWLTGNGGTSPQALMAKSLTPEQRTSLASSIEEVEFCYAVTARLREAFHQVQQGDISRSCSAYIHHHSRN